MYFKFIAIPLHINCTYYSGVIKIIYDNDTLYV